MPPVADSSRPGPPTRDADASSGTASSTADPSTPEPSSAPDDTGSAATSATDAAETPDDESSHTRVFTTDEPIPDDDEPVATVAGDTEQSTDDGWIDDTAIFTPEGAGGSPDGCGACGESIPRESVTFCPNCGERL